MQGEVVTRASRIRRDPEALYRTLDGEAVVLGARTMRYYGLDPVGTRVWSLLGEPTTVDAVVKTLVREYEVADDEALADVLALVADLVKHDLVEVVAEE